MFKEILMPSFCIRGEPDQGASSGVTCDHSSKRKSIDNGKCATKQYLPTLLPGWADPACTGGKRKHALCNYIRARPPCSQVGLALAALSMVDVQIKFISVSPPCSQVGLPLAALRKVDVQIKLISVSPPCSQVGLALLALRIFTILRCIITP